MTKMLHSAVAMASLALSMSAIDAADDELCSITPLSFAPAKIKYPELAFAIDAVEEYSITAWYTDRQSEADKKTMLERLTTDCSEETRLSVVVYGMPNKDCKDTYSSGGSVKTTADYKAFLSDLTTAVGTRKALYVVEPDAIGLLADKDGCGAEAGYEESLQVAIEALSVNPNAELYIDVGYWTIDSPEQLPTVAKVLKKLSASGKIKGIVLNTSNYRSTKQMSELCTKFQKAVGSTDMHCIIDTSRNYLEPTTTEWCNVLPSGIGVPPTSNTSISNVDYFMWIKVMGESDGTCVGGPEAGLFFDKAFQTLWDEGYLVKELGMNPIAQGGTGTTDSGDDSQAQGPTQTMSEPTQITEGPPAKGTPPSPSSDTPTVAADSTNAPPAAPTTNCKVKRRIRKL